MHDKHQIGNIDQKGSDRSGQADGQFDDTTTDHDASGYIHGYDSPRTGYGFYRSLWR